MSTPIWKQLGLQDPVQYRLGRTTQTICRALELYAGGTNVIIVTPSRRERGRISKILWECFPRVAVTTCLGAGVIRVVTDDLIDTPSYLDTLCTTTILLWDHGCRDGHGEMSVGAARTDIALNREYNRE